MPITTIYENESVALWFHPEKKIVHHKMKKWVADQEFRTLLDKGYDQLRSHKAIKWLSDDRGNSALKAEDEQWVKTDWLPRVLKAGWKYWGVVLPEKVVGQMNLKRHAEDFKKLGITVQVFTSPEDALKWLESV